MEIDPPEYSQAVYRPPSGGNDSSLQDNEVDPSLLKVVKSHKTMATADAKGSYEYDLIVVGGGSGGLACAKAAAKYGAKVACFDFVKPSPAGTSWGLGGTCVNVGCIPKKIMHYAGLLRHRMEDAKVLGWEFNDPKHNWVTLTDDIGAYIKGLNFSYRTALSSAKVTYINAYATFTDAHTITYEDKKTKAVKTVTGAKFVLAMGGRPNYPEIPGWELGISSDDIFWRDTPPGKTLVVGGAYIALECAGFLKELGYDTTVMARSILLRGFDQQCAEMIGEIMKKGGTRFIRPGVPTKCEKTADGKIRVFWKADGDAQHSDVFDTVLWAIGRTAVTQGMGLEKLGLKISKSQKIIVDENEQTSIAHMYAIGDAIEGRPELTPVAIKAGQLLASRLFGGSNKKMDYHLVPTTVFTPYEYGCVGFSQEEAEKTLGKANVEVFLSRFGITEFAAAHRKDVQEMDFIKDCFAKLVCDKTKNMRVIGFHVIGPDAGEVTQGYATALRCGATKQDFDDTVGIHPTLAEEFTTLEVSLSSGKPFEKAGGC